MTRFAGILLGVAACGGKADDLATDYGSHPLAAGMALDKVSINQGVEKVLYIGPGTFNTGRVPPPVILGRDALIRVAFTPLDDVPARNVAVVLRYRSGITEAEITELVVGDGEWEDADLETTANFRVPGVFVTEDLSFDVALREVTPAAAGAASVEETTWSTLTDGLDVAKSDRDTLVIIPIQYQGDGSGRLPDTSPAQIAAISAKMYAMFPLEDLEVVVDPPLVWSQRITPFTGWEGLLSHISELREDANVPENTYYYALFNAMDSVDEWCAQGCILGLSFLSPVPTDTWARASMGVGFSGPETVDIVIHEVGHAHGREHAPCNLYGQASDPAYPYGGAQLGSWGYDIVTQQLVQPQSNYDVMSYCTPAWVSDYTYTAIWERVDALRGRSAGEKAPWQVWTVDGDGEATPSRIVQASAFPGGTPERLELLDDDGARLGDTDGWFLPYSHLPGGQFLAPLSPDARRARRLP